jgi:hypothetical protein
MKRVQESEMRFQTMLIAVVLMASATFAIGGGARAGEPAPSAKGIARIEALTAGRTAGEPTHCIIQRNIKSVEIISGTAIVYEAVGGTLYVNTPSAGAAWLRKNQLMITDTFNGRLCNIDSVQLTDIVSRMPQGSVILQRFVPYPKPAS